MFTELLPRQRPTDGECYECEHVFLRSEGPQAPRTYAFTTREIAVALLSVGRGDSYRVAARFIRRRAQRLKVLRYRRPRRPSSTTKRTFPSEQLWQQVHQTRALTLRP